MFVSDYCQSISPHACQIKSNLTLSLNEPGSEQFGTDNPISNFMERIKCKVLAKVEQLKNSVNWGVCSLRPRSRPPTPLKSEIMGCLPALNDNNGEHFGAEIKCWTSKETKQKTVFIAFGHMEVNTSRSTEPGSGLVHPRHRPDVKREKRTNSSASAWSRPENHSPAATDRNLPAAWPWAT